LGAAIGVPGNRVSDIVRGKRDVSADTAIRLSRYFGGDPRFWLDLQAGHDLVRRQLRPLNAPWRIGDNVAHQGDQGRMGLDCIEPGADKRCVVPVVVLRQSAADRFKIGTKCADRKISAMRPSG
jgi:hypothetical protein